MSIPTISSLPEIPAYSDANFETKAPAVLSALRNTFIAEMNAAIAAINNYDYGAAVNANIITGQVAVANGGTGLSELAAGRIPYGAGTGDFGNSENFVYKSEKLGIGTTAPSRKMHIKDETNPQFRLEGAGGGYCDFFSDQNGNLHLLPLGDALSINCLKFLGKKITGAIWDSGTSTIISDIEEIPGILSSFGLYEINLSACINHAGSLNYVCNLSGLLSIHYIYLGSGKAKLVFTELYSSLGYTGSNKLTITPVWYDSSGESELSDLEAMDADNILRLKVSGFLNNPLNGGTNKYNLFITKKTEYNN